MSTETIEKREVHLSGADAHVLARLLRRLTLQEIRSLLMDDSQARAADEAISRLRASVLAPSS